MWQIIVANVVGAVVGAAVIAGGGWLYTRMSHKWKNFSAKLNKLDELSAKLDEHETAPTGAELSDKLDKLSAKLDEHETAATLAGHGEKLTNLGEKLTNLGEKLSNLENGQANLEDGQVGIDRKLERILKKLPN